MVPGRRLRAAAIALGAGLASVSAWADVAVIVSAESPVHRLSVAEVADIFLGRLPSLPDGSPIMPIDQSEGAAVREEFYAKAAGKSPPQLKAYWARRVFTGRGRPPKAVADSATVRRQIAADPALIGYVEPSALDRSVRVVLTLP